MQNLAPEGQYNYISWVIDGIHHQRVAIRFDRLTPLELSVTAATEFHDVEIYKETEASCGQIVISSIEAEAISEFPLSNKQKIEFIGNSITVGMASDASLIPCEAGTWYDQHNAYEAYGPRIARALHLDYMIVAVSGIGAYRNSNTDYPVMSDVYENTFLTTHPDDPKWNFNAFIPDIVTICLGTNDFSDGDGITPRLPFDSTQFINRYVELIEIVHRHYPDAMIMLLNSPVAGESNMDMLNACLMAVKQKAESSNEHLLPISVFSFKMFQGAGCTGHPGVEDHERMAKELVPFIKKML